MGPYETIEVGKSGPVATVTLHRPEVRNAFDARMIAELTAVFGDMGWATDTRVVVLRGAGASFSAGADVNWMRASLDFSHDENLADAARMSEMFQTIDSCPLPVVARVHGAALGGGMGLLAVCDVAVAASDTTFGFTEARLGIIPAVISPFVLPKIGESWARALFLSGERFGADLAQRIGLVHAVAPPDELDNLLEQKVNDLLTSAPHAIAAAKRLIAEARGQEWANLREHTAQRIAELRTGTEGQEGLRAFLEKRRPAWWEGSPER